MFYVSVVMGEEVQRDPSVINVFRWSCLNKNDGKLF